MSQALAAQGGLSLLDAWGGGGEMKQVLAAALGLGFQVGVAMPHSRSQESEADEMGLVMMARAGFDPAEAVALWEKMATLGSSGPEFLSTHPAPKNRAKALAGQLPEVRPLYRQAQQAGRQPVCVIR
jgi:predicted Zn-dependent protease